MEILSGREFSTTAGIVYDFLVALNFCHNLLLHLKWWQGDEEFCKLGFGYPSMSHRLPSASIVGTSFVSASAMYSGRTS